MVNLIRRFERSPLMRTNLIRFDLSKIALTVPEGDIIQQIIKYLEKKCLCIHYLQFLQVSKPVKACQYCSE